MSTSVQTKRAQGLRQPRRLHERRHRALGQARRIVVRRHADLQQHARRQQHAGGDEREAEAGLQVHQQHLAELERRNARRRRHEPGRHGRQEQLFQPRQSRRRLHARGQPLHGPEPRQDVGLASRDEPRPDHLARLRGRARLCRASAPATTSRARTTDATHNYELDHNAAAHSAPMDMGGLTFATPAERAADGAGRVVGNLSRLRRACNARGNLRSISKNCSPASRRRAVSTVALRF